MNNQSVVLNGQTLTVADINHIVQNPKVKVVLGGNTKVKVRKAEKFLNKETKQKVTYGVNTGFGPMASYILGHDHLIELQHNLIRSHATGMGDPIQDRFVLAAMVVRLNTMAKGYSGVSWELLEHLRSLINHRITPIVPEHGAVGTSGDLVQLAHIALAVIGEGEANYEGKRYKVVELFKKLKIKPYPLKPKEGLALINGTSCMTGIAAVLVNEVEHLLSLGIESGSLANELVQGFTDSMSKGLQEVRPHRGQKLVAAAMRELLKTSKRQRDRKTFQQNNQVQSSARVIPESVQEIYSLRCVPQILGPIFDTWEQAVKDIEVELNSVTDNPIVDASTQSFLHGGNFHGDYISLTVDKLKIVLAKLALLTERRINFLVNPNINNGFPPFLNLNKPGLTLGLQALQFVATSTAADCQTLAYPHYVHSISTNGDNQDVVSMGTDAALFLHKMIENLYIVLTVEFIALTQAMDFVDNLASFSEPSQLIYKQIRKIFPKVVVDRPLYAELQQVVDLLRQQPRGVLKDIDRIYERNS